MDLISRESKKQLSYKEIINKLKKKQSEIEIRMS